MSGIKVVYEGAGVVGVLSGRENLWQEGVLVETFPMFDKYKLHREVGEIEDNTAYFICDMRRVCYPLMHRVGSEIVIDVGNPDGMLDSSGMNRLVCSVSSTKRAPESCGVIVVRSTVESGRVLCVYLVDRNILIASDWVHSRECADSMVANLKEPLSKIFRRVGGSRRKNPKKSYFEITLGADPEFELLRDGSVVNAESELELNDPYSRYSEIGFDGAGSQVEFRPNPASSPVEAVANLKRVIDSFADEFSDYDLSYTGDTYPLGGHIHFGAVGKQLPIKRDFTSVLDNWIGRKTIMLSGSARGSYGYLNQVREQSPYGFEYRSLPAAIFGNRRVLEAVYKICYKLAKMYYNGKPVKLLPSGYDDYKELGLLGAIKTVDTFVANYHRAPKSLMYAWGVREPLPYRPQVYMRDEWVMSNFAAVKRAIYEALKDVPEKKVQTICQIVCFGLKSDRGNVFYGFGNNRVDEFKYERFRESIETLAFGFSYEFRKYLNNEGVEFVDTVKELTNEIKRRVK